MTSFSSSLELADNLYEFTHCQELLRYGSAGWDFNRNYLIKGILPAEAFVSLYGPSGSYKSFSALSWACHIACGVSWDGHKVEGGSVLYVAAEGGAQVAKRVKAWEQGFDQTVTNLARIDQPIMPSEDDGQWMLIQSCKAIEKETGMPVKLIVLDTLARCFGGNDENSTRDMNSFISGCDYVKQKTGATVMVVHHTGKVEASGARGSSALRAAVDAEYRINRTPEVEQSFDFINTKMKDGEPPGARTYSLNSITLAIDDDGDAINSLVVVNSGVKLDLIPKVKTSKAPTKNELALWQCVRSRTQLGDDCTVALIRDDYRATGGNVNQFSRTLSNCLDKGILLRDGDSLISVVSEKQSNVH